jgi:CubicO group peptidase (beta-lactamase class C family)
MARSVTFLLSTITLTLISVSVRAEADHQATLWPGREWPQASPEDLGLAPARLAEARDYALTGGGAGMVIRHGRLAMAWGDLTKRYDLKSTTKSIGVTALGLALADGRVTLDTPALSLHPGFGVPPESNRESGLLPRITLRHLATHTAGFEKPGGYRPLVFEPGTAWAYSDGGPNWLAECLTLVYRRDLQDLLFERVFTPLGITAEDLVWRTNAYRPPEIEEIPRREFGAGILANVDAMARLGYLYLHEGRWRDDQILPRAFVRELRAPLPQLQGLAELDAERFGNASDHYGLLWWNNGDGSLEGVASDAFWSWGLYDSLIIVIPSLDLVAARAGRSWTRDESEPEERVLHPFLKALTQAAAERPRARDNAALGTDARPRIAGIQWTAPERIVRRAQGSDNWPMAWANDDRLYTAYGDGWGFSPRTDRKLSLGLAVIDGSPEEPQGTNLRSPTAEQIGDGSAGRKASGMLAVDGTLYMLVRNAGNAQLAWSTDHGRTWTWSDWRFETSFGCPSFVSFGPDYAGARDDLVYIVSPDTDTAYERAPSMVMARVHRTRLRDRDAYTFFEALAPDGLPRWTADIQRRGPVAEPDDGCYRPDITYNAPLGRYLWCQTGHPQGRGLTIREAPEPWGPWTTVYHTDAWGVDPGESCRLPAKWMSADGLTVHLLFSGDDCFAVRRARLLTDAERDRAP